MFAGYLLTLTLRSIKGQIRVLFNGPKPSNGDLELTMTGENREEADVLNRISAAEKSYWSLVELLKNKLTLKKYEIRNL